MKQDIHPDYNPAVFVDGEHEFITSSTMKSGKTRMINDVKHYVFDIAISSKTHPFWTGTQRLVDTQGRVERFNQKYGKSLSDFVKKKNK